MKKKCLLFTFSLLLVVGGFGCNNPPNPGFRVSTRLEFIDPITGLPTNVAHQNINVSGEVIERSPDATGRFNDFSGNSGSNAYIDADDRVAPAIWLLFETSGQCAGDPPVEEVINPGEDESIFCSSIPPGFFYFTVDPSYIDADNPPANVTIHGTGMNATGGMPSVEYWNSAGQFVASAQATEVAPDGTWLRGSTPNLSQVHSGRYLLRVRNATGEYVGSGIVDVYKFQEPPPPPDPNPCYCPPDSPCMPCDPQS